MRAGRTWPRIVVPSAAVAIGLACGHASPPAPTPAPAPAPAPRPAPGGMPDSGGGWRAHHRAALEAILDQEFARAERELERALHALGEGPEAERHRVLVQIRLASVYRNQYRFEESEALLRALIRRERERDGRQLARALEELGLVYLQQDEGQEACPPLEEAHAIFQESFGSDHPALATSEANLAGCRRRTGRHEEAVALYHRALEKYGRLSQPLGASIALNNLALTLAEMGRTDEAEIFHERAIRLSVRVSGRGNVNHAKFTRDLAKLYLATGREEEAKELLEASARWFRMIFGPGHREVVVTESLIPG